MGRQTVYRLAPHGIVDAVAVIGTSYPPPRVLVR